MTAFVAPMATFLILTAIEGSLPRTLYPAAYTVKAILVAGVLLALARVWRQELRFTPAALGWGTVVGLFGLGLWLVLDRLVPPLTLLGKRTAFDPFHEIASLPLRYGFLAVRFLGLAMLVPVIEELFWRSFLPRLLTSLDHWDKLALDKVGWLGKLGSAALFALAHPEWLAALAYALLLTALLRRTQSLAACVVAHAVTNGTLGIYVLVTHHWQLW